MTNTRCPECRAWLKAKTNFTPGEKVTCPKCETPFTVRDPEGAFSAKTDAEREFTVGSRGSSILWYATFALLVAGIAGLGYAIAEKMPEARQAAAAKAAAIAKENAKNAPAEPPDAKQPNPKVNPKGNPKGRAKGKQPDGKQVNTKRPDDKQPVVKKPEGKQPEGKKPEGKAVGIAGLALGPLNGMLGGPAVVAADEKDKLLQKYKGALVGTWRADLGGGVAEELSYTADGAYSAKRTGPEPATASGKYSVKDVLGTKTVKIQLDTADGAKTVTAVFEGDELQHPSLEKGVVGSFRKK